MKSQTIFSPIFNISNFFLKLQERMSITNGYSNPSPIYTPLNKGYKEDEDEEEEDDDVGMRAGRIANAMAFPMVLKAALEMGVIETISAAGEGAWLSPSEIARGLPTKPTNPQAPKLIDRMLCLLASYSVVKCRTRENGRVGEIERTYRAGPVCRFFMNNNGNSGSLVPFFMLLHGDVFFKTWNHLKDMILEGKDAFICAHGMKLYEYVREDEPIDDLLNRAMSEHSIMIMKKILETYKGFEGVKVLVDVGGGIGTTLDLITSKYPHIRGINFDVSGVIAEAPSYPGVEHVNGDMFVEVPKGGAIFMKRLLHGWNDEDCVKILRNCWKSLSEKRKVIIVDTVIPDEPKGEDIYSNVTFDLDMLLFTLSSGGRARTQAEFQALAERSGFARCELVCRAFYCSIVEFHKESDA